VQIVNGGLLTTNLFVWYAQIVSHTGVLSMIAICLDLGTWELYYAHRLYVLMAHWLLA